MAESLIEPPLKVRNGDGTAWDAEADIVVVGFGAAGATAAIEARTADRDVLVVDRFEGGGATRWSGGIFYAGATRFQRDAGKTDTSEEMFKYLATEVTDAVSPETLRRFCGTSNDNVEWLVAQGVGFEGSLHEGKTTFPDEDKYLYYSGNEKVPSYAAIAKPAPRGHRIKGRGWTGYVLADKLKASALAHGARLLPHARAMRLVVDDVGRVIGVDVLRIDATHQAAHQKLYDAMDPMRPFGADRAEKLIAAARKIEAEHGSRALIRARRGIVLAAGGFAYNIDMVRRYMPAIAATYRTLIRMSALSCDGTGIDLGASVGGACAKMDNPFIGRMMVPPEASVTGLMVNKRGERFINEDTYVGFLGKAIAAQPDGAAWLIVDDQTFRKIRRQALELGKGTFKNFGLPMLLNILLGGTKKARSLAQLEKTCGFPAGTLERTVADFNSAKDKGLPDPQGKSSDNCAHMGAGPYHAINSALTNLYSFMPFFTLGGLCVDQTSGQVLDQTGKPIEGLYAAGRNAVGVCSDGYFSGMSLADCVFSGRRAANALSHAQAKPVLV